MQGNRLADLWPILRKLLIRPWWKVPRGLRGVWLLFWVAVALLVWAAFTIIPLGDHPPEKWDSVGEWVAGVLGTGVAGVVVAYLLVLVGKAIPGALTKSFADVVRYLDTSPRSYEVRRQIRKGFVELLETLHNSQYERNPRYGRIVIVAHSLGAYIAYDGICHTWATMNDQARTGEIGDPVGLSEVEEAAAAFPRRGSGETPTDEAAVNWRQAQHRLWCGLRRQGNPWLITDLITVGTPMYFADVLYTDTRDRFNERVERRELPTCPPQNYDSLQGQDETSPSYSYTRGSDQLTVLYDAAPFAVVRWTNMWFPAWPEFFGFFGDWFGGPLRPLFGNGVHDIPIKGNRRRRWVPGYAHTLYFKYPDERGGNSVTRHLDDALDLNTKSS